jgi:hypothetical protein
VTIERRVIPERRIAGKLLGRHLLQDSRSWRYPAPMSAVIQTTHHAVYGLPLDQGAKITIDFKTYDGLGSCTGNAETGMLMSEPFYEHTMQITNGRPLDESDAVRFYSRATHIDRFSGVFPVDDTGSSGLAAMKAAKEERFIDGYAHCFSGEHALRTIVLQPTISGFNWYEGMDNPDDNGVVHVTGNIRGGHEFMQCGLIINEPKKADLLRSPNNFVENMQSWGPWGINNTGRFLIPVPEFIRLMGEQGDVKTGILL